MVKTAITPTKEQNYPEWYQQVIVAAGMADNSPVRGCMVIKPWGYAIWELIQKKLDYELKETGHLNAYFPLLIPLSLLEKEASHVEGFAKECAVVTHYRLIQDKSGKLIPDGKLEEPYIIRPTSETISGETMAKWVNSYRDLPILINQWANIMRWEMRTRMFIRTSEFLWQEGHTVHETEIEAQEETLKILEIYTKLVEDFLGIPVIQGIKPCFERFPGAVNTYCIEAMMQDKKALQAGTSHFLGQNFSKAAGINFTNRTGNIETAWTTSWGVTTRLIGGVIMVHGDNDGLVLPPTIAPYQIVIIPIYRDGEEIENINIYCENIKLKLSKIMFNNEPIRVFFDKKDMRGGDKVWQWIKKGVPIRLEVGPRDVKNSTVSIGKRTLNTNEKLTLNVDIFVDQIIENLNNIQQTITEKARKFLDSNIFELHTFDEFKNFFSEENNISSGFVKCYAIDDSIIESYIKPLKVTARCIPLSEYNVNNGKCIFTGKDTKHKMIFAKSY